MHACSLLDFAFLFFATISLCAQVPSTQPLSLECASLAGNETCTQCISACASAFILCSVTCARRPAQCEVLFARVLQECTAETDIPSYSNRHASTASPHGADAKLAYQNAFLKTTQKP